MRTRSPPCSPRSSSVWSTRLARSTTAKDCSSPCGLCRVSMSASGLERGKFDVGAYETEHVDAIEVDAQGRHRWVEHFASDRLGDAVARLYERYAELLPAGPARERAAGTARSVRTYSGTHTGPF